MPLRDILIHAYKSEHMKAIKDTTIYGLPSLTKVSTEYSESRKRYVTKAVNEICGLFAEKFAYNEDDALSDHALIVSNAKSGVDDFVPNDVLYRRAKQQST